ncbi:LMBR1-like membrane protein [Wolffia australiana]
MVVFYFISLPLTLGMVAVTLRYFAGPDVPRYVLVSVGYAWFCSLSIIILVPADIWTTIIGGEQGGIGFFWSWSYWSTFALTWAVVPTIQCYEDAGDFTVTERLKTSIRANLIFYLSVGSIGVFGLLLLIIMRRDWSGGIVGLAMACSNTFGLVTGAFLLGFGLSEIPKSIWKNADWDNRQKVLSHRVAKMAVNLDDAHQEFSNAIVVTQATSNQMTKRDPLRPYMDVIDDMLRQMLREDPSFKPSGGRLGENDMDYDTDEKSMATLRRQLRRAREEYYRYKSAYMNYVMEALELEDTIKNYERRDSTGWKYISSFRPTRTGSLGSLLDTLELVWRCILRKQVEKLLAIALGSMSAAILLAEATLLPSGVDLSLFSILIKAVGKREMLVQIAAFVPLMYMCICTYYSLFKIGMLMFYSLTPKQTSSVSLLMICSMVARYAAPISYNFLNLIRLGGAKTIFEKRMGNIDDAVPFFGRGFNKIYPLIMVVYTILVASNFFGRVIEFLGNWKRFKFQDQDDDMNGFDPSGVIILQKERQWLEQGRKVGEQVIPLARNFNGAIDEESAIPAKVESMSDRERKNRASSEIVAGKYLAMKEQKVHQKLPVSPVAVSLLETTVDSENAAGQSTGIAATWASMKSGFQNFTANVGNNKFLPLRRMPEETPSSASSSASLDEIFQRLQRRPNVHHRVGLDDDDDDDNDIDGDDRVGMRR